MRKHFYTILGVIVYGGILCGLLALQLLMIDGVFPRIIANLSALALTVPTILILTLYHRKIHHNASDSGSAATEEAVSQTSTPDSTATMEEIRAHVYDFLRKKSLSNRELEVAWLIYRGYTNIQIAEELYISETTVKKHASHIYEKLEVTGRKEYKAYVKSSLTVC